MWRSAGGSATHDLPRHYTAIILRPLSRAASADLVAGLLGLDSLPSWLRGTLERAAGTPFRVEELARTLIERDLLLVDSGCWQVSADLDRVEIPNILRAHIVAPIDASEMPG